MTNPKHGELKAGAFSTAEAYRDWVGENFWGPAEMFIDPRAIYEGFSKLQQENAELQRVMWEVRNIASRMDDGREIVDLLRAALQPKEQKDE